jgi:hypothetical protein
LRQNPRHTRRSAWAPRLVSRPCVAGRSGRSAISNVSSSSRKMPEHRRPAHPAALQGLAQHVRCAGEETVLTRIVGRPHDLVRADILGQHRMLSSTGSNEIQQFRRNSSLGRIFGAVVVEAPVVEIPVHPVEPRRNPAAVGAGDDRRSRARSRLTPASSPSCARSCAALCGPPRSGRRRLWASHSSSPRERRSRNPAPATVQNASYIGSLIIFLA